LTESFIFSVQRYLHSNITIFASIISTYCVSWTTCTCAFAMICTLEPNASVMIIL
jgi:hypothetical protein